MQIRIHVDVLPEGKAVRVSRNSFITGAEIEAPDFLTQGQTLSLRVNRLTELRVEEVEDDQTTSLGRLARAIDSI